jgi:hypothetical protein
MNHSSLKPFSVVEASLRTRIQSILLSILADLDAGAGKEKPPNSQGIRGAWTGADIRI